MPISISVHIGDAEGKYLFRGFFSHFLKVIGTSIADYKGKRILSARIVGGATRRIVKERPSGGFGIKKGLLSHETSMANPR